MFEEWEQQSNIQSISDFFQQESIQQYYDFPEFVNQFEIVQQQQNEEIEIILNDEDKSTDESYDKQETLKKLESIFKKPIKNNNEMKFQNECRYLINNAIQAMQHFNLPDDFKQYYKRVSQKISGFQALRQELLQNEEDNSEDVQRKLLFQRYLLDFLWRKGTLFILKSKKKNLKEYLRYKNKILLFYVRYPHLWKGNQLPCYDSQQHMQSKQE